jgi:hypothetical protein
MVVAGGGGGDRRSAREKHCQVVIKNKNSHVEIIPFAVLQCHYFISKMSLVTLLAYRITVPHSAVRPHARRQEMTNDICQIKWRPFTGTDITKNDLFSSEV